MAYSMGTWTQKEAQASTQIYLLEKSVAVFKKDKSRSREASEGTTTLVG
jgi:hypothetical protein